MGNNEKGMKAVTTTNLMRNRILWTRFAIIQLSDHCLHITEPLVHDVDKQNKKREGEVLKIQD